jgi:hypothetical protein
MDDTARSIFRHDALHRYGEGREQSVLPRLVAPRTFRYLWCLVGLLLLSGIVVWSVPVPTCAAGPAVVIRRQSTTQGAPERMMVVAFFSPQYRSRVQTARTLLLHFDVLGARLNRPILAVGPEVASPEVVQQRFALPPDALSGMTWPATVVMAPLEPLPAGVPASAYLGSIGRATVPAESRRIVALFPAIGLFFQSEGKR